MSKVDWTSPSDATTGNPRRLVMTRDLQREVHSFTICGLYRTYGTVASSLKGSDVATFQTNLHVTGNDNDKLRVAFFLYYDR